MQVADISLFGDTFKLFDTIYPVGYVYPQYPGQKDPNEMWGDFSTWEQLDYGGAFFRAANGNSEEFEKTLTITDLNGTNITFEEEHGLLKGSILYDAEGNESRLVDEITDEHTVVIDRVFSSITLTNVYATQNQGVPDIGGFFGAMDPATYGGSYWATEGAFQAIDHGGEDGASGSGRSHQGLFKYLASKGEYHGEFKRHNETYENYVYGKSDHVTVTNFTKLLWVRIS